MKLNVKIYDKYFLCKKNWGFEVGMGDSPSTGTGTGIPRNLLNGDWFGDGGGDGERGRGWYCHTRPLPGPLPSLSGTVSCCDPYVVTSA